MTRAGDQLYSDDPRFYSIPRPAKRLHFWRYLVLVTFVGAVIGKALGG